MNSLSGLASGPAALPGEAMPESRLPSGKLVFATAPGKPLREYYYYIPASAGPRSEMLVLVHGITRNAAEYISRFRDPADAHGLILVAPLFTKRRFGQYQQVVAGRRRIRADLALFDILDEIGRMTGADTSRVHLFGYSGGAQFVHRFAMFHPARCASISVAAAGWYTMPDDSLDYPLGIAGMGFDKQAFLAIDRLVLVGEEDRARDESLRTSAELDALQGRTRVARAYAWADAMAAEAERLGGGGRAFFEIIPGAGHAFGDPATLRVLPAAVIRFVTASSTKPNQGK